MSPTIETLWTAYYHGHVLPQRVGLDTTEGCWNNLKVAFGQKRISAISQAQIDKYEADRLAGRIGRKSVSATVRRELVVLRAILRYCAGVSTSGPRKRRIAQPLIKAAELPEFSLPESSPPRDRWHTHDEMALLLKAAEPNSRGERFLYIALHTGARMGAILDLTWDRIDFENRMIHFNVPGRRVTKKRRTSVPMSRELESYLRLVERRGDLVMENHLPMWPAIQAIAKRAGVKHTFPNAMRHTAGTQMARADVALWKVAKVLGNSLAMVEQVYAKHSPEDLRDSVNSISGGK